jgi:hypothetical protein
LHRLANPAETTGFLFPVLPTIAGLCVRVRVKLGSTVVSTPWITRRRFGCPEKKAANALTVIASAPAPKE